MCDLTGVKILGAKGLSVLVETRAQADAAGIVVWLVIDALRPVPRALELTELAPTFRIERRLSDAVPVRGLGSR